MNALSIIILLILVGIMVSIIVRYIVVVRKNYNAKSLSYIRQEHVQNNILSYGCNNEGESLNDSEIYEVPYEAVGY